MPAAIPRTSAAERPVSPACGESAGSVYLIHPRKAFGAYADNAALTARCHCNNIKVYRRSHYDAVVVVGVVAAYLCAPRCGIDVHLPLGTERRMNPSSAAA